MKLPRSLRDVTTVMSRFNGSTPSIDTAPLAASPERMRIPGVRATTAQGTSSSANTPDPLHPGRTVGGAPLGWDDEHEVPTRAIFSEEHPNGPGAPGTVVSFPWTANPSVIVAGSSADRSEQQLISGDLQLGPAPNKIPRYLPTRMAGSITGDFGSNAPGPGFPWNGDFQHIDHLWTARAALGTKGPQKLSDDNAVIPAVFAGNPKS